MKPAIIIASFGTSYPKARRNAIERTENAIRDAYPSVRFERAFTSRMIINKIQKTQRETIYNEQEALQGLREEGYDPIKIQPLHIIPGHEYHKLKSLGVPVGRPLIDTPESIEELCRVFDGHEDRVTVLMGHGSDHEADHLYGEVERIFQEKRPDRFVVGTVEGERSMDHVLKRLEEIGKKEIELRPFMLVAGDHALHDMASDEEDSWKSILLEHGYDVVLRMEGLGESDWCRKLFVDRVEELI